MNIVVFAPDVPYPANRGGRADIWRRMLALRALGHQVMLVNLFEATGPTAPTPQHLAEVDRVVAARFSFPMKRGPGRTLRQLAGAWWTPWHAATRIPDDEEYRQLGEKLERFRPDLLWLEGAWFGPLVERVSSQRRVPYAYRSHNVEHTYLWGQARAAVRLRDQVAWRLACVGVKRMELRLMKGACAVFDISMDDLAFWASLGVGHLHWLPPLPELAVVPPPARRQECQVLFVGNLATPNNVRGVEFLLGAVWPLVLVAAPDARLTIVGSNPTRFVRDSIRSAQRVDLQENVPDPLQFLLGAKVLVNPVMTGSGVQLKTMDMLLTDAPIVTTRQGLRGLPPSMAESMVVVDDAAGFAAGIVEALGLGLGAAQRPARRRDQASFTVAGIGATLQAAGIVPPGAAGN